MRWIVVLLLIVGAAGWWWMYHRAPESPKVTTAPTGPFGGGADPGAPVAPTPTPPPAAVPPAAATLIAKADALWDADKGDTTAPDAPQVAALYSQALRALYGTDNARADRLIGERLSPLGKSLFYSKARYPEDATGLMGVTVAQPGDIINKIARRYGMSQQFLNRLRGASADEGHLDVGDALKVVSVKEKGGFAIHICKSTYTLDLYVGGVFAKRYAISEGTKETPTPVGKTHLINRCWHPDWTNPHTKTVIKFGDPANILGPIWLPFNGEELGQNGIGIHGYTGAGAGAGQQASSGCIRLNTGDDIELYDTLSQPELSPTAVEIVE